MLSGAGLSAASGVPTFRDLGGLWEGHDVTQVASPEAWHSQPALVRRFYDARRIRGATCAPNAGHRALVQLQQRLGPAQVTLITQNVDGLLELAGAHDVLAMHGSLWRLRCSAHERHPRVPVQGAQDPTAACARCGALLRPDIVWFGEVPHHMARIGEAVAQATTFLAVGTSGLVYPAAGLGQAARRLGAHTVEINPVPSGAPWFDEVIAAPAEVALPSWVDAVVPPG